MLLLVFELLLQYVILVTLTYLFFFVVSLTKKLSARINSAYFSSA